MIYEPETRIQMWDKPRGEYTTGKIVKHVPSQGSFAEVYVIDWDDGRRTTEWAEHIQRAADDSEAI